ncbi:hypothetical protein BC830DRAFT_953411 [Chytriomyces sp. MP71]|nr:hypothetical protein BC830DRAFT_953411 [Chytriomyces sp. MP71]
MIPTYQIIKVRFTTDSAGPQFDGFSARWWTSEAENRSSSSACPNNCYSDFGRGACSEDGICACLSGYSGVDCHNDDQWKLQTFFSMCNGSSWISSQNWLSGSQPCNQTAANARNISLNWVGVGGCVAQRVTTLALPANNVCCSSGNATFPSYLRSIDLSDNHLSKFPKFVSNLPQLTALELGGNGMSGPVPASFFSNSELGLISLNLSCNNLSGRFDSSPWIPGLLSLDLHQNSFEGWVPDSLGSMAVPGSVYLQNNSFLCPATNYASVNNYSCVNFSLDSVSPSHILMPISAVVPSKLFLLDLSYIPQSIPFTCLIDGLTPVPASIYNSTTIMCSIPPISPGAHSISISIDPSRESSVNFVPLSSLSFIVTTSCPPGSHLIQDAFSDHCATCPAGAACRGGTAVPESAPGYFESPQNALVFLDCFNTAYCLGNNTCSAEAMGERCAFCADGFVNVNGNCVVCQPGQSLGVAIGFVIAGLGLPVWWIWRAWMGDGNAAYGILIMYFQIIGLFDKYPINWDSMLGDIVKAVSIAILNTDYINLQCAYGLGFYERMFFVWTIPFMIGAIFKLVVLLKSMWLSRCTGFSFTKHMAEWDHYASKSMFLKMLFDESAFQFKDFAAF